MDLIFLGTGGAWGVPEIACDCLICETMRQRGEKRDRTSLLLSNRSTLLIDCGSDARAQLLRHDVQNVDAVLISHEHGDHFIGLDELFAYKRNRPREDFRPIPVFLTSQSREVVRPRFSYLEEMEVLTFRPIEPYQWFKAGEFEVFPFRTSHGAFSKGAVGFLVQGEDRLGNRVRLLYTSDFMDLPRVPEEIREPDYLIIQSFWLNEPIQNRPHHMSFQRAIHFIERLKPRRETFLVHLGDADMVPGDPANRNAKKYEPREALSPGPGESPYPIPLNQEQWQDTVDRIAMDRGLPYIITVAYDDLQISI